MAINDMQYNMQHCNKDWFHDLLLKSVVVPEDKCCPYLLAQYVLQLFISNCDEQNWYFFLK